MKKEKPVAKPTRTKTAMINWKEEYDKLAKVNLALVKKCNRLQDELAQRKILHG